MVSLLYSWCLCTWFRPRRGNRSKIFWNGFGQRNSSRPVHKPFKLDPQILGPLFRAGVCLIVGCAKSGSSLEECFCFPRQSTAPSDLVHFHTNPTFLPGDVHTGFNKIFLNNSVYEYHLCTSADYITELGFKFYFFSWKSNIITPFLLLNWRLL